MKKTMSILVLLLVCGSLAACGGTPTPDVEATVRAALEATQAAQPTDTPTPVPPTPSPTPAVSPAEEHFSRGADYMEQEMWEEAITEFQEAIWLEPDFALAHEGLGYSYAANGEFESAIVSLETYLELEPDADDRAEVEELIQQMRELLTPPTATPAPPTNTPLPPTNTPVPPTSPPVPRPTNTPVAQAPPPEIPCYQPIPAGQGALWCENHIGSPVNMDIGPNFYQVPAKQGDTAGCLWVVLPPGHHVATIQTLEGGGGHAEFDITAGRITHLPLYYNR